MRALALVAIPPLLVFALASGCGDTTSTTSTTSTSTTGAGGDASTTTTTSTSTGVGGAASICASCDGACVDLGNDPAHCGACDHACGGSTPVCDHGQCQKAPCEVMGPICPNDHLCCGMECCPAWKVCCRVPGSDQATCVDVDAGACPTTCSGC